MSANEKSQFPERVRLAIAEGDVAEVERLQSSSWCAQWTAARAKDVFNEIRRNGGTLNATRALHNAVLIACESVNQLSIVRAECNALKRRIEELERRLANTQTNSYRGVWKSSETYAAGSIVTHGGTIWFCHVSTHEKPGGQSGHWQLMVKHARD